MTYRAISAGIVAGALAALAFTVLHNLIISQIWFMLVPMLVAGALCGLLLGWSYILLVETPTVSGWLRYNGLYLILLFSLGPISLVLFEPMMTIPALLASPNGLPSELAREVAPLAAVYTIVMALIITLLNGRSWAGFMVALAASAVLMLLRGMNIAPMGRVFLTSGWLSMLLELLVLILTLNLVYALTFIALGRGWLWNPSRRIFSI